MILFSYRPEDTAGYKCILETPISSACRRDEDRVTYLNKGKKKIQHSAADFVIHPLKYNCYIHIPCNHIYYICLLGQYYGLTIEYTGEQLPPSGMVKVRIQNACTITVFENVKMKRKFYRIIVMDLKLTQYCLFHRVLLWWCFGTTSLQKMSRRLGSFGTADSTATNSASQTSVSRLLLQGRVNFRPAGF